MSPTDQANEELSPEKYRPLLQGLNRNILVDVESFFARYFEEESWSMTARNIAGRFTSTEHTPRSRSLGDSCSQELLEEWVVRYLATFSHGSNTYCSSAKQPLAGFEEHDTPTLYLVSTKSQEPKQEFGWADVQAFGQFDSGDESEYAQNRMHFCMHAWRLFNNQPTRCFLHGFHVCGHTVRLWVFDRAGAYCSSPFSINDEANQLLVAIAGYTMMNEEELGLNRMIRHNSSGSYVVFRPQGDLNTVQLYLEEKPIRRSPGFMFSGPACYRARSTTSQNWEYVIKFAWREESKTVEEDVMMLVAKRKVWGVVQLFAHQHITSISTLRRHLNFATTQRISLENHDYEHDKTRTELVIESGQSRYKDLLFYCVAVHPIGRHMEDYESIQELLYAFRDVVKGHRSLYFDGQILHRDVSKDNMMISSTQKEGSPRGFLIDLDTARMLETKATVQEKRKGTRPFMAIAVLSAREHTYRHDLESVFYCFLWIAICGRGQKWPPRKSLLWNWFQKDFEQCAQDKSKDMQFGGFDRVLAEFSPEFFEVKALARKLWSVFFPIQDGSLLLGSDVASEDSGFFYQLVINAFSHAAASVKEVT